VGEGLHARLRDGFNVPVYCEGGVGRAGIITARLLIGFACIAYAEVLADAIEGRPRSEVMSRIHWKRRCGRLAAPAASRRQFSWQPRSQDGHDDVQLCSRPDGMGIIVQRSGRNTFPSPYG
jgi:hypothetical protein